MALKRMVLELGQGTDIRGADSTKAAERAVRDALWRNNLQIADALGQPRENMDILVRIGAPAQLLPSVWRFRLHYGLGRLC